MRFHCDGAGYNTDDMIIFAISNRAMPFIYLSKDAAQVFVQTMDRARGVSIRRAQEAEIRRLAEDYHLPQLLQALPPPEDPGDGKGIPWARPDLVP